MGLLSTIKETFEIVTEWTTEHAPAILTGVGVAGLGATAYLTYKATPRIEEVVEYVEDVRDAGEELDKGFVFRELTGALALPMTVGITSVMCIVGSYQILTGRLTVLSGAFGALSSEYQHYRNKYGEVHGEEESQKFFAVNDKEWEDENGEIRHEISKDLNANLTGFWYSESMATNDDYASDDHQYNLTKVEAIIKKIEVDAYDLGYLTMNDVFDYFSMPHTKQGALLGWRYSDFTIDAVGHLNLTNIVSQHKGPDIFISWNTPQYMYGKEGVIQSYRSME